MTTQLLHHRETELAVWQRTLGMLLSRAVRVTFFMMLLMMPRD